MRSAIRLCKATGPRVPFPIHAGLQAAPEEARVTVTGDRALSAELEGG